MNEELEVRECEPGIARSRTVGVHYEAIGVDGTVVSSDCGLRLRPAYDVPSNEGMGGEVRLARSVFRGVVSSSPLPTPAGLSRSDNLGVRLAHTPASTPPRSGAFPSVVEDDDTLTPESVDMLLGCASSVSPFGCK